MVEHGRPRLEGFVPRGPQRPPGSAPPSNDGHHRPQDAPERAPARLLSRRHRSFAYRTSPTPVNPKVSHVHALLHGGAGAHRRDPALHVVGPLERGRLGLGDGGEPWIVDDVCNRIRAGDPLAIAKPPVEHSNEALRLGEELVERLAVSRLLPGEGEHLTEEGPRAADLPVRPREHLRAARLVFREEAPGLVGQVLEHRARFEDDHELAIGPFGVDERGDLPVGVDRQVLGLPLLALPEVHEVELVRPLELGQQDGGLLAVRGSPGVEVEHGGSRGVRGALAASAPLALDAGCARDVSPDELDSRPMRRLLVLLAAFASCAARPAPGPQAPPGSAALKAFTDDTRAALDALVSVDTSHGGETDASSPLPPSTAPPASRCRSSRAPPAAATSSRA